ncbi:MAG: CoB--CoM heterodisulfide reductase iron-sulfur subunit A family protein [Armatimonadetes bacterium]|nr:CoB--CoM heterodisulfide reductase iron-sulfur subunit A family protein [Armatimonadota bacterium]MDW8122331.1 CoB--CoM heterodisulfide reductase iron-sulfur subunit A family protein [Armatimonadota bacterium]
MARIGVFVCHCGENIARTVRVKELAQKAAQIPGVVHSEDYIYMCSEPGQKKVRDAIQQKKLTGVVVAACSPQLHELTFRKACQEAGLNPYLCEMANIREQCSWVHTDREKATQKAYEHLRYIVEKVRRNRPLRPIPVPITPRVLVIGGGIAGIQAALDIADGGVPVTLVERQPSIGGNMARLSETFPTLDCAQCILTPKMVSVRQHPNIELLTYSEVEDVKGFVGNFQVTIKKKPRYVDEDLCTGCGDCAPACPSAVPNEFDRNLSWRKAIYIPFPQAVPPVYTLDPQACLNGPKLFPLACERCYQACGPKAINFNDRPKIIERKVGAIIVATGYELLNADYVKELGYGLYPDVMDGLEFERLLSASGPTGGEVVRPSDHKVPKTVVFIQCVGSRNPANGVPYCSRICCMYTAKHALLYKHKVPEGKAFIFYMDIRAGGKGYEEFIQRVMEQERITYIRGAVSKVYGLNGKLMVQGVDTLSGQRLEVAADLVVLATAMVGANSSDLVQKLRLAVDRYGFGQEAHPKLRPVETLSAGIFLAGVAQAPKDIPDTVAQASAAAGKALALVAQKTLEREPTVASVNEFTCVGCFECQKVCPYGAIERKEIRDRAGNLLKVVSTVNTGVCNGCGACVVACRNKSMDLAGFSEEQIFASLAAVTV